jgi:hypothetical protein
MNHVRSEQGFSLMNRMEPICAQVFTPSVPIHQGAAAASVVLAENPTKLTNYDPFRAASAPKWTRSLAFRCSTFLEHPS